MLCDIARAHGYALTIHGTLQRDLDLVAIPWTEEAVAPEVLVKALRDRAQWFSFEDSHPLMGAVEKPHGRRAWTIPLVGDTLIDLSIMPRSPACATKIP